MNILAKKLNPFRSVLSGIICFTFLITTLFPTQSIAQSVFNLPAPGIMIPLSTPYNPALVKGITIYPENPLKFDFIINPGDDNLKDDVFNKEAQKLIKYFMASLTVPEGEMWVNLSPYEKDRIIADGLSKTELGRDLLSQDYILKQVTASLMYPEEKLGSDFWQRVYAIAETKYGITEIPTNTFNKIWIVPEKANVFINANNVFVIDNHLKVMLEEDYLALENNLGHHQHGVGKIPENQVKEMSNASKEVIREILIPEIEREVNQGKNFANLRQIFNSMILATWYKQNLKKSLLGEVYVNQNKIDGIALDDKQIKEKIYNQYVEAFKKGVFDYIKEDYDATTQQIIPRKYFSGGFAGDKLGEIGDRTILAGEQDKVLNGYENRVIVELSTLSRAAGSDLAMTSGGKERSLNPLVDSSLDTKHLKRALVIIQRRIDEGNFRFSRIPLTQISGFKPRSEHNNPLIKVFKSHIMALYGGDKLGGILTRIEKASTDGPKLFMLHELIEGEIIRVLKGEGRLNPKPILEAAHIKALEMEEKAALGLGYTREQFRYYRSFLEGDGVVVFPAQLSLEELSRVNQMAKAVREILAYATIHDKNLEELSKNDIARATEKIVFDYLFFQQETMGLEEEAILRASAIRASAENKNKPTGESKSVAELLEEDNLKSVLQRTSELRDMAQKVIQSSDKQYFVTFTDETRKRATLINRKRLLKSQDAGMLGAEQEKIVRADIQGIVEEMDAYKNKMYYLIRKNNELDKQIETAEGAFEITKKKKTMRSTEFMVGSSGEQGDLNAPLLRMSLRSDEKQNALVREKLAVTADQLDQVREQEFVQAFNEIMGMSDFYTRVDINVYKPNLSQSTQALLERTQASVMSDTEYRQLNKALLHAMYPEETKMSQIYDKVDDKIIADYNAELPLLRTKVAELKNELVMRSILAKKFQKISPLADASQYLEFIEPIIHDFDLIEESNSRPVKSIHERFLKYGIYQYYWRFPYDKNLEKFLSLKKRLTGVYNYLKGQTEGNAKPSTFSYNVPNNYGRGNAQFTIQVFSINGEKAEIRMIADTNDEWRGIVNTAGKGSIDEKGNSILEGILKFLNGRIDPIDGILLDRKAALKKRSLGDKRRQYAKILDAFEAIGYRYFNKVGDSNLATLLDGLDEPTLGVVKAKLKNKVEPYIRESPSIAKSIKEFESKLAELNLNNTTSFFFTHQDGIGSAEQVKFANDVLKYVVYDGRDFRRGPSAGVNSSQKFVAEFQRITDSLYALNEEGDELRIGIGRNLRSVNATLGITEFVVKNYTKSDAASLTTDNSQVGGIDLNPNNLNLNVKGSEIKMNTPETKTFNNSSIDGFIPVIINVVPITNIPLLLGSAVPTQSSDSLNINSLN